MPGALPSMGLNEYRPCQLRPGALPDSALVWRGIRRPFRALGMLACCLCLLYSGAKPAAEMADAGNFPAPPPDPAQWTQWLPADRSGFPLPPGLAAPPLTIASGDSLREPFTHDALIQKWTSGPASLPWNDLALELIEVPAEPAARGAHAGAPACCDQ